MVRVKIYKKVDSPKIVYLAERKKEKRKIIMPRAQEFLDNSCTIKKRYILLKFEKTTYIDIRYL